MIGRDAAGGPVGPGGSVGSVTLHSSWRGIVGASFGAAVVALGGTYGVWQAGFRPVPGALFVLGWLFVLGVALDYPIAARFTPSGVERRMLLRRQMMAWDASSQLTRTRPSLTSLLRVDRELRHGGSLALKRGRRRYLLVDQVENGGEYDRLVKLLGPVAEEVGLTELPRPPDKVAPTWMYRRRRWRPESGRRR